MSSIGEAATEHSWVVLSLHGPSMAHPASVPGAGRSKTTHEHSVVPTRLARGGAGSVWALPGSGLTFDSSLKLLEGSADSCQM